MSSKPTFDTIISVYHQEVARGGTLGALGRAAKRLNVSHETVRRAKIKEEQAQPADELLYIPPPDGYPEPVPQPVLCRVRLHKPRPTSPLLGHNVRLRRADRDSTFHTVNEHVEIVAFPQNNATIRRESCIVPVRMSPAYQRRLERVNSFNIKPWLALAVALLCIALMAAHTTSAAQPMRVTFTQHQRS